MWNFLWLGLSGFGQVMENLKSLMSVCFSVRQSVSIHLSVWVCVFTFFSLHTSVYEKILVNNVYCTDLENR